mmetsp:Transcript_8674/g.20459  ORF Transcript_8674/g.20459 Transcript_8674/m.20459 type:complete len:201 (-) Transcript_8674:210-812(-)
MLYALKSQRFGNQPNSALSPQVGQKSSRRAVIHLTTSAPVASAPGAANTSPSPSLRLRRTAAAWRACCVRPGRACTLPVARRPRETRAIWQCSLDRAVGKRGGAARPVRRDEGRALVGGASVGGGLEVGLHGLPHLLLRVELLLRLACQPLDSDAVARRALRGRLEQLGRAAVGGEGAEYHGLGRDRTHVARLHVGHEHH